MPIWIAVVAAVVSAAAVIFTLRTLRQRFAHRARVDAFAMLEATTGGRREASTLTVEHPSGEVVELWVPLEPKATPLVQVAINLKKRASTPIVDYRSQPQPRTIDGRPLLRLRRETWLDRLGRSLRINRELQTGDTEFDREVYIDSDARDEDIDAILADRRVRDAVRLALACGFSEVEIGGKRNHLAVRARSPRPEHLVPETISAVSDALAAAAPCLPRFISNGPRLTARAEWAEIVVGVIGLTTPIFLLISLFIFNRVELVECIPLDAAASDAGWSVGVTVALVVSAFAAWLIRGTSSSVRTALICMVCLLLWVPMSICTGIVLLNGMLDRAMPTVHRVRVLKNVHRRAKIVSTNHVRVESWRPHERYLDLALPSSSSYSFSYYNDVSIVTRPGAFGWECIDSVEPILDPGQPFKSKPPPDEIVP